MISFSIHNFGCRVNQAEAFAWADELQEKGLKLEKDYTESDLILINSCTLTSRADRDVKKFVNKIPRLNPKAKVIVTGCFVERAYDEFKGMPHIWRLFRNAEKYDLASQVLSLFEPKAKQIPQVLSFRSRALLKIQDGCNFRCTFCIIPKVRGRGVSFPQENVLSRVEKYISQGFKEIVLTGIHICSYGRDLVPKTTFLELLKEIEKVEGLGRVRLSSLDPRFLTLPLLEYITSAKKMCPHFHLSLQHGSDDVLRRMGRRIGVTDYQRILTFLRQHSPQASLGADIMIGFPGESKEDFKKTLSFLDQSPLTYLHVFPYSPRPGTPASFWPQIDEKEKRERANVLRRLSQRNNLRFRLHFLDEELDGIVVRKKGNVAEVLTSNYFKVSIPYCPYREKDVVRVKIKEVRAKETVGEIISS